MQNRKQNERCDQFRSEVEKRIANAFIVLYDQKLPPDLVSCSVVCNQIDTEC